MAKKKETATEGCGIVLSEKSVIITDDDVYKIKLFDIDSISNDDEFDEGFAYIDNGLYYLFRGKAVPSKSALKPGIYEKKIPDETRYFVVQPETEDEKVEYDVTEHAASLDPLAIVDVANKKEEILVAIPESTKIFQPTLLPTDDLLKRIAKLALIYKNVDLDHYKDRFTDKNALFNFKQVIKGDNKLSFLIFNRGVDALNLKYTVILEEKDPENFVGNCLKEPIVISSEDTYEI